MLFSNYWFDWHSLCFYLSSYIGMRKRGDTSADEASLMKSGANYDQEETKVHSTSTSGWNGDGKNIVLLLLLYLLQGIPLGLIASIPLMLQNRQVSYKEQAQFSLVYWPFSLKLLWAPIVDSVYSTRMGRRKTWLVPVQYALGLFMLVLSSRVDHLLGSEESSTPDIGQLTMVFFILNFLAATQDIAVDGWALTMLKRCLYWCSAHSIWLFKVIAFYRQNVGYASTCNSVGQTAGYFLGYVVFVALESPDFCDKYLRTVPDTKGILTLSGMFLQFLYIFEHFSVLLHPVALQVFYTFGLSFSSSRRPLSGF